MDMNLSFQNVKLKYEFFYISTEISFDCFRKVPLNIMSVIRLSMGSLPWHHITSANVVILEPYCKFQTPDVYISRVHQYVFKLSSNFKRISQLDNLYLITAMGISLFIVVNLQMHNKRILWQLTFFYDFRWDQLAFLLYVFMNMHGHIEYVSRVSCQKGPTHHAYAWQIGPFWQDTLDLKSCKHNDVMT